MIINLNHIQLIFFILIITTLTSPNLSNLIRPIHAAVKLISSPQLDLIFRVEETDSFLPLQIIRKPLGER
jgi:hypothetical protein